MWASPWRKPLPENDFLASSADPGATAAIIEHSPIGRTID